MDDQLLGLMLERIDASELADDVQLLVLAACQGETELIQALGGDPAERPGMPVLAGGADAVEPPGASIASVTVEGFRGIGSPVTLTFPPGPGLTLVIGRNGSGKSSFAEALEVLLTGDNERWAARSKVWKDGWRNLHQTDHTQIEAQFLIEGQGETSVIRTWEQEGKITDGSATAQPAGKPRGLIDELGWGEPLVSYRPFLSYNELGSLLEGGPAGLYDALAAILGLEDLTEAQARLTAARTSRERARKDAKDRLRVILSELESSDDQRAATCIEALSGKDWELETVEAVVIASPDAVEAPGVDRLRALAVLEPPVTTERAVELVSRLNQAARDQIAVADTAAAKAHSAAEILSQAIGFHADHGDGDCPVCGAHDALNSAWHEEAVARSGELRTLAEAATTANAAAGKARADALRVLSPVPAALENAPDELDVDDLMARWNAWCAPADVASLEELAARLEDGADDLVDALDAVRADAKALLDEHEDAWKPFAMLLASWLEDARAVVDGDQAIHDIRRSEEWLKQAGQDLRSERFHPVADRAKDIWNVLRMQSNVELADVTLEGTSTSRRVEVHVNVDGEESAALGVMSQGELHALALSLFFPRATLPESPFRFVVVDDPVQSMDPARVDGLARVLDEIASTRQVIVFTHDDRLPQSVRALGIDATVMEVLRRKDSVVEVRRALDPVARYLEDARALALTDHLPVDVAKRTVPGFCRLALEAAFTAAYRRAALRGGKLHADIEAEVAAADTTNKKAALGLFGDVEKTGQVMAGLNKLGHWAGTTYKANKEGAHEAYAGDLMALVRNTEKLTTAIQGTAG
jgi:recombinational DNA repair ATPase RecF